MSDRSLCLLPKIQKVGGPGTFQKRLIAQAEKDGLVRIHFDPCEKDIGAFLIIGAPRRFLFCLIKARLKNIPVIQRLDGMNWVHRCQKSGILYAIHSEMANFSIAFYRRFICSAIIYQSSFSQDWWNRVYGKVGRPETIIYNGTDLESFKPNSEEIPQDHIEVMLVEGNLSRGLDFGVKAAISVVSALADRIQKKILLRIAGNVPKSVRESLRQHSDKISPLVSIIFTGVIDKEMLIRFERRSAFLISEEINAACPNSVIEAMACGLPVIGFDTGSLKDVVGKGGIIVPYGNDPWKLENPIEEPLVQAAEKVIIDNRSFRVSARKQAELKYNISKMTQDYIDFCFSGVKQK